MRRLPGLLGIENLERRLLLAAGAEFAPLLTNPSTSVASSTVTQNTGSATPIGLTPQEIRAAYGIDSIRLGSTVGDGTGQTIAIIGYFDDPDLVSSTSPNFLTSDLHEFDVEFGLPDPPSFLKLDENGGTNYPQADPNGPGPNSAETEMSLDVEWAHAIAPGADIDLIEAIGPSSSPGAGGPLEVATTTAENLPGVSVVSMSFGSEDEAINLKDDPLYTTPAGHAGITFVAAAGDSGAPGGYPAFSPNVLAVGGTSLSAPGGAYAGETAWSLSPITGAGGGGGQSTTEGEPSYQAGVQHSGWRQMPDVAFDATTGVAIDDSYDHGASTPWSAIGGTSLSAPCWAGLIAIADQLRATKGLPSLDGPTQTLPALYSLPAADFHDITVGNNGFPAGPGFDMATGLGSPVANLLVPDLASFDTSTDLVTEAASLDQSSFGRSVTFTATVAVPPGSAAPTGTVTFLDGGVALGTATLGANGEAVLTSSSLSGGNHVITASYGGDSHFPANSALVEEIVGPATTTTVVTESAATSSFGQAVTLTATVTAAPFTPATPTGTVEFLVGSTVVGAAALQNGVAVCNTRLLPAGVDTVTAYYQGDGVNFAASTSDVVGPASIISTVSGNGIPEDYGDGGLATLAALDYPFSVAVDAAGDLFIAESDNRVREVNHATGVITTVAGNGVKGYRGDGGQATAAELNLVAGSGIAVDNAGNLFIADLYNEVIRKVNLNTGIITTVAGNGVQGLSGDGGPATSAELDYPDGVALDAAGDLFIEDSLNARIREVNHATGVITTVAGTTFTFSGGDGGPATAATLDQPISVAVDAAGDIFILDNGAASVREVNHATGIITTVAGAGPGSYFPTGDGGPATAALLCTPVAIAVDAAGDLFIAGGNGFDVEAVREVNHTTGLIETVAGNQPFSFYTDGGPAGAAGLENPYGLAVDSHGDLLIADYWASEIRLVSHSYSTVTVSQATPRVTVSDPGGTYNGSTFAASPLVNGVIAGVDSTPAASLEGIDPTLTYYAGNTVSGNGTTSAPTSAGPYTVVAAFPGSLDYTPFQSSPLTFTIGKATPSFIASGGAYDGNPFPATVVGVTGSGATSLDGVGLTCTYSLGGTSLGNTAPTSAGTYTVVASFPGSANYVPAQSIPLTFTISEATPTVSVSDPGGVYDGAAFAATALVSGVNPGPASTLEGVGPTFTYDSGGTVSGNGTASAPTSAGTYTVVADFPGSADYAPALSNPLVFTIGKATPIVSWANPAGIVYGTPLSAVQLDASTSVAGVFVYSPPAGTVLPAGLGRILSETFTPTDPDFAPTTTTITLNVAKASPILTWPTPAGIIYGTALGAGQLDATANIPGTWAYSPALGTALHAGSGQTLSVTFTPTDATDDNPATSTTTINVAQATPVITWLPPADIVYGTMLGAGQLDAISTVPGSVVYTPSAGTTLQAGIGQTLSATFTPTNASFAPITASTTINVQKATPTVTWPAPADILYGTALGSAQLDASASVPGLFAYGPLSGTVLYAGIQTLSAAFTPSDAADYATATATTTLDIARSHLTVKADNKSRVQGAADPALTATISGFVNGDTPAVITGSPFLTSAATTASPAGVYPITVGAGTLSAANYDFPTLINNTLTVTPPASLSTSTDVQSSEKPANPGDAVTFTATVTATPPGSGVPTGTVQFAVDSIPLGAPIPLMNGTATSPPDPALKTGNHVVTAAYVNAVGTFAGSVGTLAGGLSVSSPPAPGTVSGMVFDDANGNGQLDPGEPGISGRTVYVDLNGDGVFKAGDPSAVTDASGDYTLTGLAPGTYALRLETDPGDVTTDPAGGSYSVALTAGQNVSGEDFGVHQIRPVTGGVTSTAPVSTYGQSLIFTATVVPTVPGGPPPTGTVQFQIDGTNLGSAVTLVNGSATSPGVATPLGAGGYTVTALYSGDPNDAGISWSLSQTVMKAPLTITAAAETKTYGAALPVPTATILGFVNGDNETVLSGAPLLTTTAKPSSPPGRYPITVTSGTLSAANYDFPELVAGTLTVTKAHLTVTADNMSRPRGTANPRLAYTLTGFVNGDKAAVVKGSPVLSTTATTTSPAGRYTIRVAAGTLSSADYDFPRLVNGTLTATAAAVGAVWVSPSIAAPTFGQALTFTVAVSEGGAGSPVPTGKVQFQVDGANFGKPVALVKGVATSSAISALKVGHHTVTAIYSGDHTYRPGTTKLTLVVSKAH